MHVAPDGDFAAFVNLVFLAREDSQIAVGRVQNAEERGRET